MFCLLNQKYLFLKFHLELLIGAIGKLVNIVSGYKLLNSHNHVC